MKLPNLYISASIFIACLCSVTSCSVKYTSRVPGFQPGYVDEQLGSNTYQVRIGEAWSSDWPNLEKFALYRAADISESKGYRYYAVLNSSSYTNTYYITSPSTSYSTGSANIVGSTAYINTTTTTTPGITTGISGGWYVMDYKLIEPSEISNYERVVDSEKVKKELQVFIDNRR